MHGFDYTNVDLENEYSPPNVTPPLVEPRTFFSYNLDKQLTNITRPDGQVIFIGYDTGGRLSTITMPENPPGTPQVYSYTYFPDADPNVFAGNEGNLQSISAPDGGTLAFSYDGSLLLSSTWGGTSSVTGSVSRTYDINFRIASRSVNGANTISFGYDNDSLLTSAGAETLAYNPENPTNPGTFFVNGLLRSTTLGEVADTYQYNSFGEVSNYSAQISGTDQYANSFVRDKLGRITQKTETVQSVTHTFDYMYNDAGYLVEVKRDGAITATYTYDLNGNRQNNSAVYDNQDRLTSTSSAIYTYRDSGELLTKTEGADITEYEYDVLGNLLSVTLSSGTLIEYIIDGKNRRIGRKVDGALEKAWLYKDSLNPIAELDGSGNVIARFVYASKVNVPDYVIVPAGVHAGTYRIISDHLGSPRLIVNIVDGSVKQAIEYDEWGNETGARLNDFPNPFTFAGGLYDAGTKLVRFGARDYVPETGRWTSKDPIDFDGDGPNLYGYVLNDPINFFDALGLEAEPAYVTEFHDWVATLFGGMTQLSPDAVIREFIAKGDVTGLREFLKSTSAKTPAQKKALIGVCKKTKGIKKSLETHKKRLKNYIKNPDAVDNKGHLKRAGNNMERRKDIIQGRINKLEGQIKGFQKEIDDLTAGAL